MNRQGISIGKLFGIPIILDYSWFLIVLLFSTSLAQGYYPSRFDDWSVALYWVMGTITALSLFGSVLLHELGHSLTAMVYDIPVQRIRLIIFGGVAELGDESPNAMSEFLIAIMGPVVSLLTSVVAFGVWVFLRAALGLDLNVFGLSIMGLGEGFTSGLAVEAAMALFSYLAVINVLLAVFNMVPGFPLDGGRVFRAFLWGVLKDYGQATRIAVTVGRLFAFGFIAFGIFRLITGNFGGGLWMVLIGFFMQGAARSELQMQRMKSLLQDRVVAHLMMHNPRITRWVGTEPVSYTPEEGRFVSPDTDLWSALKTMEQNEIKQIPVMREESLLGVLRREDIFGYLRVLQMQSSAQGAA